MGAIESSSLLRSARDDLERVNQEHFEGRGDLDAKGAGGATFVVADDTATST